MSIAVTLGRNEHDELLSFSRHISEVQLSMMTQRRKRWKAQVQASPFPELRLPLVLVLLLLRIHLLLLALESAVGRAGHSSSGWEHRRTISGRLVHLDRRRFHLFFVQELDLDAVAIKQVSSLKSKRLKFLECKKARRLDAP